VDEVEEASAFRHVQGAGLPIRWVTVNSIVALNLAFFRKAAGLKQEELAERLGWGKTTVSTAERSWNAKRVRSFSVEDLIGIAAALEIPVAALFLPPEDHGVAFRYVLDMPGGRAADVLDLLSYVFPGYGGDSPAMDAYRKRVIAVGGIGRSETEEVERIIRLATEQAQQAAGETHARAETLEPEVQERHRQAVMSLFREREELLRRINDLRSFEREYRTRLQAYFERSLRELWSPEGQPEKERLIQEVRARAAEGKAPFVTALLLREDGTYDALEFGASNEDEGVAEEDAGQDEGASS
jgi:transcriptional regulator with XRE-family HTH domain